MGNTFIPIDEVEYNTADVATSPYPLIPWSHAALSNIYPYPLGAMNWQYFNPTNFDFAHTNTTNECFIFIPVPSRRLPPLIPNALTQPSGGFGLDLNNWAGFPITLKWRLFTPNGDVLDSNELTFPSIVDVTSNTIMYFAPDNQIATITETSTHIYANHPPTTTPNNSEYKTFIRVAVFQIPEGYRPVLQKMLSIEENYQLSTINEQHIEGSPDIFINRTPFIDFTAYQIALNKTGLPPGNYTMHVRHHVLQTASSSFYTTIERESYFYDFTIPAPPEPPPAPPLAPDFCVPKIPAVAGESWDGLYRDENGDWLTFSTTLTTCHLANYCTCFELVSEVPSAYIDIVGYFRGAVLGRPVPTNAKHKARFIGQIKRIADQYESESFVSSAYASEDIVRAYSERFEIELLIFDPCQLSHVDLLKFAEKCDVVNRNNRLLPSEIRNLKFEEVNIENDPKYARVRITLRRVKWRDEYRRNA
jgi:hypothetical protein